MTTAIADAVERKLPPHTLLDRGPAAEYLGVKKQTLAAWALTGRYSLPYIRVGRCVKYRVSDLDAFLAARTVFNTGEASQL